MIIKFEVNGAWQIYDDVDSLMYRKLGNFTVDLEEPEETIDFTETISNIASPIEGYSGRVLLSFMNSKQLANSQVIAFSPIYLMNENGKNIDVI